MRLTFDPALPIAERHDEIAELLTQHQVVVIAGETGSGKTTQLPKIAYELGRRHIAHTQPRRIAARSVARRIADECEVELGDEIGYAVRFDDQTSDTTAIKLMTDGLLLAELQGDPDLRQYDTVIIDEAHERSLAIDFLLGYLKRLLPRRPDLQVIITSATIDVARFSEMFDDAPVIEVSGRTYPVEVRYRPLAESDASDLADAIDQAIRELPREGDILVFLSGEREIRDTAEYLGGKKYPRTEILPLYGRLAAQDQQKIFSSHPGRRIVLSTNVAETSLTVPGIRYVIDSGLARISRYSNRLKVQRLPIEPISQASAAQRAGRCGRVADGICIRLYSEEDFDGRPEFTDPEILRTNLASVLLQMAALKLGDIDDFPFLDPPDRRAVNDGLSLLTELGALDGRRLTKLGRTMSGLPVDPRLGRMLLAADRLGCLADVLVIVAAMSIQDPRERPLERQQAADEKHRRFHQPDSDFLSYMSLWTYLREQRDALSHSKFRRMCHDEFIHYLRVREWQDVHSQLRRTVRDLGMKPKRELSGDADAIHQALLTGLLGHVALREPDGREFLGARGARVMVFPGSGLAKKPPRWIMAGELVETSRLWARTVARVDPDWIEKAAGHLLKRQYAEPYWSSRRGTAMAKERATLYGIPVVVDRPVQLSRVDPVLARELFIRHALVEGDWRTNHRFFHKNRALLDDIAELEDRLRRRDLRVDDQTLFDFYDERLPQEIVSARHFDSWWKKTRRQEPGLLTFDPAMLRADELGSDIDEQFPTTWTTQSSDYDVEYVFDPQSSVDGLVVTLPVDELLAVDERTFGWHVPGHRRELVTELIRTLPKAQRRNFAPAGQYAERIVPELDVEAPDIVEELARRLSSSSGMAVRPEDFDPAAVPDHLRVTYRIVDDGEEIASGKDLAELRRELEPRLRSDLHAMAEQEERTGLTRWEVGTLEETVEAGQIIGYPALVDDGDSVSLRVLSSADQQQAAMVWAQSRLIALTTPSPASHLASALALDQKLLLSTAPYRDPGVLIEDARMAALDALVVRHGGPVQDENAFTSLAEAVRADVYPLAERTVQSVVEALRVLGDITPGSDEAGEDVKVQLSWLVYPGFVREMGADRMPRLRVYLEAARRRLRAPLTRDLAATQDLEARFHGLTGDLPLWLRRSAPVQEARWALEELRVSLLAQDLRAAIPVSVKRVTKLLDALEQHLAAATQPTPAR
ncbi:ATP-dependent RNA helicase HrpA [Aeromicrobium sp. PE09-221]|uniref:ATP-dependent RNA helicase HrpA n=1 Tax=Aeromicrobium sp. PE09-221 TaxID=1898043 RepID=UPI000B3EAB5E|nr:ATP-dependent RNA helicase HrpA [Aeromicrobium sp. PE09-221]OUZ08292.1 ATP-dependent RNA helicase HrpA [Aeromicrobium sp. PE09-221]